MSSEFGFQIIKQLLEKSPDREINFKDLEGKIESVSIKDVFLKSVSEYNFEETQILVPTTSLLCKNFFEFVKEGKEQIESNNLYEYYKLASFFKMPVIKKMILNKIENEKDKNIIKIYDKLTENSFTNQEDYKNLEKIVIEKVCQNVYILDDIEFHKEMTKELS
jgi:hypothetical protein